MIVLDNKFEIGQSVYLVTDTEQLKRLVIAIEYYENGELLYKTVMGTMTSYHYQFELSTDKDLQLIIT